MLSIAYPRLPAHGPFDDLLFGQLHRPLDLLLPAHHHPAHSAFHSANLSESEQGYVLSVAAPGVNASDLKITCDDGLLSLTGTSSSNGGRVRTHRSLSLPDDADVERASVTHENGLVHVNLPKRPVAEPRSLELVPLSEQPAPDASTHYRVALPAAGVAPSDLTITLLEGEVKVSGRSKPHGVEYSIERVLELPRDAGADGAAASLVDGILTLTLPKVKRATGQTKQLPISTEGQHGVPAVARPAATANEAAATEATVEDKALQEAISLSLEVQPVMPPPQSVMPVARSIPTSGEDGGPGSDNTGEDQWLVVDEQSDPAAPAAAAALPKGTPKQHNNKQQIDLK